ncbi:MAG: 4-hydroxythreonine-4-phosphate dehydrogenase PdxA [Bacteroidia bacterium]|nr:4-hydroxythreonine-4-phosphate dehydrogenase PdxA [Bacteroidia bacterium]
MESNRKLRIGITIGDVNGIGPELIIKAFEDSRLKDQCVPILYGSSRVINIYRKVMGVEKFNYVVITTPSQAHYHKLNLIECVPNLERVDIGVASEASGEAAYLSLKRAIEDAQHQELDALVTMPVNKATIEKQEPGFVGHTEMLAEAFNAQESLMLMVSDQMRIGVVTTHVPVKDISAQLTIEKIVKKVRLMNQTLKRDFTIEQPMIAVLGLNPHAGDDGLIGEEEKSIINPALIQLQKEGINVFGPYPADGFFGALTYRKFDGIMAMYHDQGLIPFKLLAGYSGVNFTAGLPVVRTSPDHGVAYDIAGKDIADPESLRAALYLAIDVVGQRRMNEKLEAEALGKGKGK